MNLPGRIRSGLSLLVLCAATTVAIGCGGGSSSAPAPVQPPATQAAQLKIATPSLPAGSYGHFYQAQFKASGGFPPYQWFPASGDPLAVGLTLDPNTGLLDGVLSGTVDFVLEVVDSRQHSATLNVHIDSNSGSLKILTSVLPPASKDQPYNVTLAESQPAPFTLASGSLPPGLSLIPSGMIAGAATQTGTFSFTVSAASATGSDQHSYTLVVSDKQPRNDEVSTATQISNGTWNASISPYADPVDTANPDEDFYELNAEGGAYVSVTVFAERLSPSSPLDGVMALEDSSGRIFKSCDQPGITTDFNSPCMDDDTAMEFTVDPMLELKVPGSGTQKIFVRLLDWRGDARPDMQYQLVVLGAD